VKQIIRDSVAENTEIAIELENVDEEEVDNRDNVYSFHGSVKNKIEGLKASPLSKSSPLTKKGHTPASSKSISKFNDEEYKGIKYMLHNEITKIQEAKFSMLDNSANMREDIQGVEEDQQIGGAEHLTTQRVSRKLSFNVDGRPTSKQERKNSRDSKSVQSEEDESDCESESVEIEEIEVVVENSKEEVMSPQINQEQEVKQEHVSKEPEEMKIEPVIVKKLSRAIPQACLDIMTIVNEASESDWKSVCNAKEVQVYKKKVEGSPAILLKAYAIIDDITPEVIMKAITDQKSRREWDKVCQDFTIFDEDPDTNDCIVYYLIKAPMGVSNRDFVQKRQMVRDYPTPGAITLHFKSVVHPKFPVVKKIVRGETSISGYILEPIGATGTKLTLVSQNDIKGLIPKSIVNMVAAKAPKQWVANLKKGCKNIM